MARVWTADEEKSLKEMDRIGLSVADMARVLNRSVIAVEGRLITVRATGYERAWRPGANLRHVMVVPDAPPPSAHSPEAVIARCTRDGRVLWQHVANQLGTSIDAVRNRYDASYRKEAA